MDLTNLPIAKTIDKTLEKPATTGGKVINSLLLAIFSPLLKYEVKKEAEIEAYKQKIFEEISKIPKEKQVDPPLNVVGPALEASKFYIEADEIKSMFAKLIASSMNIDTTEYALSSFTEIIKQLSPLDAQNLKIFAVLKHLPIAKFRFEDASQNGIDFKTNVFLSNPNCNDIDLLATSLSNINRLGLINIDYLTQYIDSSMYSDFENQPVYLTYKNILANGNFVPGLYSLDGHDITVDFSIYNKLIIKQGIANLTPLGKAFVKSCI